MEQKYDTEGYIDRTSLAHVVQAFGRGYSALDTWSATCLLDVTSLLLFCDNVRLMDYANSKLSKTGVERDLKTDLDRAQLLRPYLAPKEDSDEARNASLQIAMTAEGITRLRESLSLLANDPQWQAWQEWNREKSWVAHADHGRGLFEADHILAIEQVMPGVSAADLNRLQLESRDTDHVLKLLKLKKSAGDLQIVSQAHLVSGLIRGIAGDELAKLTQIQLFHHPSRYAILTDLNGEETTCGLTETQRYLVTIAINLAMRASQNDSDRTKTWATAVGTLRTILRDDESDLSDGPTDGASIDRAVKIARKANLEIESRVASVIDDVLPLVSGLIVHIALNHFPSVITDDKKTVISTVAAGATRRFAKKMSKHDSVTRFATQPLILKSFANDRGGRLRSIRNPRLPIKTEPENKQEGERQQ